MHKGYKFLGCFELSINPPKTHHNLQALVIHSRYILYILDFGQIIVVRLHSILFSGKSSWKQVESGSGDEFV